MKKQEGHTPLKSRLLPFFVAIFLAACGTNTSQPVYPLFAYLMSVGAPAIISLTPVQSNILVDGQYRIEFQLQYYVTNSEAQFNGYNLYIAKSATSPNERSSNCYLPDGIKPSFHHTSAEASTASSDLVTRTISHFKAAPVSETFKECEPYYFRMSAQTNLGLESNQSATLSACATLNAALCPATSPCYVP